MACVGASIYAASVRSECPARGVERASRARICCHGHDYIVVMLANPAEQFPMFTAITRAEYVSVGSAEEQRAGAPGNRRERLDVSAGRANLPPVLGIGG